MTSHASPPAAWYVVLVTTAAQMVVAMGNIVLPTIAPKVAETLQVDPVLVGYHVGLTFGVATVTSVYSGIATLRWGPAAATQLAMVSALAGLGLFALPHVAFIAAGSIFVGIGMGLAAPAAAQLLVKHTSSERRNLMFAIKQTGVPLGGVIVSLTAPALAVTLGWQWALAFIAVFGFVTLVLARRARGAWDRDRQPAASARVEHFGGVPLVWRLEPLRWVSLAAVLFSAAQRILLSFTVVYLVAERGYGLVEAGIMLSLAQIGGSLSRIPWGWLADRLRSGVSVLTMIGLIMMLCSLALVAFDAAWPKPLVYLLFLGLGASCVGWNGLVHAECARLSPAGSISLVAGGTSFFIYGGVMLGPPVFSAAYGLIGSYGMTFWLMVAAAAGALGFLYLAALKQRQAPVAGGR
jgi:MFS family permease